MNNQLKGVLVGAFILLITLLLLSKCHSCRGEGRETAYEEPAEEVVVEEPAVEPEPEPEPEPTMPDAEDIGGTGDLKVVLQWDFPDDMDLSVVEPGGNRINYINKRNRRTGGFLDVDNLDGGSPGNPAAENIYWSNPPAGTYRVFVTFFSDRVGGENGGDVLVTVFNNGERSEYTVHLSHTGQTEHVVDVEFSPQN